MRTDPVPLAVLFFTIVFLLAPAYQSVGAQPTDLTGTWSVTINGGTGTDQLRWDINQDRARPTADYRAWGITQTLIQSTVATKSKEPRRAGSLEFRNGELRYTEGSGTFYKRALCSATAGSLTCQGVEAIGRADGREFPLTIQASRQGGHPPATLQASTARSDEVLAFYRKVTQPGYRIGVIGPSEDRHRAFSEYPTNRTQETKQAMLRLKNEGIHVPSRLWENSFGVDNAYYYNSMVASLGSRLGETDILYRWFIHYQRVLQWETKLGPARDQHLKDVTIWVTLSAMSYWGAWLPAVAYDAKEFLVGMFGQDKTKVANARAAFVVADAPWEELGKRMTPESALTGEYGRRLDKVLTTSSRVRTVAGGTAVFLYFEKERITTLWFDRVPDQGNFDALQTAFPEYRRDFEQKLRKAAAARTLLAGMHQYVEETRRKYPDVIDSDWWIGRSGFVAGGTLLERHFAEKRKFWSAEKTRDLKLACIVLYVMADEPVQFMDKNMLERTMDAEEEMVKARDLYKLAYYFLGYNGDPPISQVGR